MTSRLSSPRVAYRFSSLGAFPLRQAMSGRVPGTPGDGDVGHGPGTTPAIIEANRVAFLTSAGVSLEDLVVSRQTHGTTVAVVSAVDRGRGLYPAFDGFPATDAMVTSEPTIALGVIVADCVPILLYDEGHRALGLVHAGWRGTVGGIAVATLRAMASVFGTRAEDVHAAIGPSIGPCCYEVGVEVIDAWRAADVPSGDAAVVERDAGYHFDLWAANRIALAGAGVALERIEISGCCARCLHERYFSYRATRQIGATAGRNMLIAQLLPA